MPVYTYQVFNDDGSEGETFEIIQKVSDPTLTDHPETGKPMRRIIGAPSIAGRHSESASKQRLSDSNLEKQGFTKYQKVGSGQYEKRTGIGPRNISAD